MSRWDGVAVLVTGAQGFIGAHVAERLLEEGATVVAPRRDVAPESRFRTDGIDERCQLVQLDLADYAELLRVLHEHRVRAVFHLASQSIVEIAERAPYSTWEANVRGTWTVLEACRAAREVGEEIERIVVSSSARAYGLARAEPYREEEPVEPVHPYAVSKAAADMISRSYALNHELPVAVTRMVNIYGPGDLAYTRLVPGACRALAEGKPPVLRSDGTPERESLHVDDAVDAYLAIADSLDDPANSGRAWNVGSGEPEPVLNIVNRLIHASGQDVGIKIEGDPIDGLDRQAVDSTRIREELGWAPRIDLDGGLAATYEWYRERLGG